MVIDTPFSASLPALNAGDLDAAAQVIGVPATPLRDALAQAKLQLLPLDPAAIKALSAGEDGVLMPIDIAAGTYPDQPDAVATVGTAALLLTTSELTRDEALSIVRTVPDRPGPAGRRLAPGRAGRRGDRPARLSVPLHDGAEEGLSALENPKTPARPRRPAYMMALPHRKSR